MALEDDTSRAQYATNATTGPWGVPFYFLESAHLLVTYTDGDGVETPLELTTDYTVAGAGNEAGGSVTTVVAYPVGGYITIVRDVPRTQLTVFRDGDAFPASAVMGGFDKLTMLVQQLFEVSDRSVLFPVSYTGGAVTLPIDSSRANRMLSFDSGGDIDVTGFTTDQVAAMLSAAVIDGTAGGHVTLVEEQTATPAQQVFTLTTLTFVPGVNAVQVALIGVGDLGVGDFTEGVDGVTITLAQPVLEGQRVLFRVGRFVTSGVDAEQVSHTADGPGTLARDQASVNNDVIRSRDYFSPSDADATPGIQAFWNRVTTVGGLAVIYPGDYAVKAGVTITLGSKGFHVIGGGVEDVRFIVGASFVGATPVFKIVGTNAQPGFSISGFSIRGGAAGVCTATSGLQVGSASISDPVIAGFQTSCFRSIFVADFPVGIDIVHARLMRFEDCSVWNNNYGAANSCLRIRQEGLFTTDLLFDRCQFVNTKAAGYYDVNIVSSGTAYNNATGNGSVAGLKFRSCDLYAGNTGFRLYASGSSRISDVWIISGCQIDQETAYGVYAESADSGADIQDIHLEGLYVSKTTSAGILFTSTGTGGAIRSVWVDEAHIDRAEGAAVSFFGGAVESVTVSDCHVVDSSVASGAIVFNGTQGVTCTGNKARQDAFALTPFYLVDLLSGTDNIVCTGNDGVGAVDVATVRDLSGDVTKVVTGNLGYNPIAEAALTVTASPFGHKNTSGATQAVYITGGTVSGITLNGRAVPTTSGIYHLVPPGMTLSVAYTVAPTMYATGAA